MYYDVHSHTIPVMSLIPCTQGKVIADWTCTDEASSWYVADVHHTPPLHFQGHEILSQASQAQQSSEPDNEVRQCVGWYAYTLRHVTRKHEWHIKDTPSEYQDMIFAV